LKVSQPVEFKLADNKIIINEEQVVDFEKISSAGPTTLAQIELNTSDGSQTSKISVRPGPDAASGESKNWCFRLNVSDTDAGISRRVQGSPCGDFTQNDALEIPVYSDFKVESKKISLLEDGKIYDLKILPDEIYTKISSALETEKSGKDTGIKELSVKIENEKAVYDLKVKEPFKLFWFIPMKIDSQYIIDGADCAVIEEHIPWWAIGKKAKPKLATCWPPAE
jgi:hypothetical protein